MRVISGKYRSVKLESPETDLVRPTTDRVKENIFNIVQNAAQNAVVLDLFAGSGAIGIEFLSRYAKHVYFNDLNASSINLVKKNLNKLNDCDNFTLVNKNWEDCLNSLTTKFDIIYLDPPFGKIDLLKIIAKIEDLELLSQDGMIVVECEEKINFNEDKLTITKAKKYGRIYLTILRNY